MRSGENRPERPLTGHLAPEPVFSPSRITLENNGKIRPQPDRENAFTGASGGASGIRTHETISRLLVFKTSAFNHSAIAPAQRFSIRPRMGPQDKRDELEDARPTKRRKRLHPRSALGYNCPGSRGTNVK